MFHNLPNEAQWREVASYTDCFMLTMLWNLFIYGAWPFALFIIFLILKQYHLHQQKTERMTRESLLTYQSRTSHANDRGSSQPIETVEEEK